MSKKHRLFIVDIKKIDCLALEKSVIENSIDLKSEFKRLFHGRGGCYEGFEFLTIDSIGDVLYVVMFGEVNLTLETELLKMLQNLYLSNKWSCVILQKRYILKQPSVILHGKLSDEVYAGEWGLKYKLNLLSSRNIGYFGDMKNARAFVKKNAKDKKVLNLFSYTCAFSIAALAGGATSVVNVDMSKGALSIGRINHHLNEFSTKNVKFMPYNILKSWNRIKKAGPYDMIIIDPPTFQKGSFIATNDYDKIVKKLHTLAHEGCVVLAATNSPDIDVKYITDIFTVHAKEFEFIKRLENPKSYPVIKLEKSLKNLIFVKQ